MERFDSAIGVISRISLAAGSVLMLGVMVWIVVDVVTRSTGTAAVSGTHAVVSNSLVVITFLFIPYVVRTGRHIRSTILVLRLPQRWQRRFTRLTYGLGGVLFLLLAYASWDPAVRALRIGEAQGHGGLLVPTYPVRFLIVATSLLVTVECVLAVRRAGGPTSPPEVLEEGVGEP